MIKEKNSRVWRAANAAMRLALAHEMIPFTGQHILVNEYPKSGGTWLTEMVGEALGIPFPQHRLPSFRGSMLQGHYFTEKNLAPTITLYRDGRDVLNSFYYHLVIGNEYSRSDLTEKIRRELSIDDCTNVQKHLPRFIEHMCSKPFFPHFTWSQFVETWHNREGTVETSYEALRKGTAAELTRIVKQRTGIELTENTAARIEKRHSMSANNSKTNKFRRKGIVGDWRNNFSLEAIEVFKHYNNDALIALNYETTKDWQA